MLFVGAEAVRGCRGKGGGVDLAGSEGGLGSTTARVAVQTRGLPCMDREELIFCDIIELYINMLNSKVFKD